MDNDINERNDLQQIIDNAIAEMSAEAGRELEPDEVNLAELGRRTGITRSRLRTLKSKGFRAAPHGRTGIRSEVTVMSGHEDVVDGLLRSGVTNSSVCLDRLREHGYAGSLSTVKSYIASHMDLVPAKRQTAAPRGSRGQRYSTAPGEAYQMDWGFVRLEDCRGDEFRIACFAMICHHCGTCYVEFFPNARQENLLIGMVHAFVAMGVPDTVLTDNMASVVTRRDMEGRPVWNLEYAAFMDCIGFRTRLCKPRHPFTKGKVERLVQFVKSNFCAGRAFEDITRLNREALSWCAEQSSRYRRALALVPAEEHLGRCLPACRAVELSGEVALYLCPQRRISFDGFVCYEGRRYGVPYWYQKRACRVNREGGWLHVYSDDLSRELCCHPVTWSRADAFCDDQFAADAPAELPTAPVAATMRLAEPPAPSGMGRFDFGRMAGDGR